MCLFFSSATQPSNIVASLFRLNEEGGTTCILLRVDAVIEVKFKTKLGSEDVSYKCNLFLNINIVIIYYFLLSWQQTDLYVPDDAEVSGDCSNEDDASLILKWKNFVFTWYFTKVEFFNILAYYINHKFTIFIMYRDNLFFSVKLFLL